MANLDRPNGLIATSAMHQGSTNASVRHYDVAATVAVAVYPGDPVTLEADGTVIPSTGAGTQLLGVVAGVVEDESTCETTFPGFIPALTGGKVLVNISPDTLYEVQEFGTAAAPIPETDRGKNINLVVTPTADQALSGRSAFTLADEAAIALGALVKLIEPVNTVGNEVGVLAARWIVKLNVPETAAV